MPATPPRSPRRRSTKSGLLISLAVHGIVIGLLVWFAAREGVLGPPLQHITVRLIPPTPLEKPVQPAKPNPATPTARPALPEPAPPAPTAAPAPLKHSAPASTASPVAAPAPAAAPLLAFDDGGRTVQTENDPAALYRGYVEFRLRSRWNRPAGIADEHYVAEVELAVDGGGRITNPRWKRKSGDPRWDAAVMEAINETPQLDRRPPAGFPSHLTVRFDVIQAADFNLQ